MSENSIPDLSGVISSLMSDERFADVLAAVRNVQSTNEPAPDDGAKTQSTAQTVTDAGLPAISPELMEKLPQIMSAFAQHQNTSTEKDGKACHANDRKKLLSALRPFMSKKRQAAIDSMINLSGIADILLK